MRNNDDNKDKSNKGEAMEINYDDIKLMGHLGEGSFGNVYEAIIKSKVKSKITEEIICKNDYYAIKINKIYDKRDITNEIDKITLQEIVMMKTCNHKNIMSLIHTDFDIENGYIIIMELAKSDLNKYIYRSNNYSEYLNIIFMYQIMSGLNYLHSIGIIHRDLKPGNILITNYNNIKIADLASCCYYNCANYNSDSEIVTSYYRAPEIELRGYYDYNSDLWSLGCVIYELYNKKYLFSTQFFKLLKVIQNRLGPIDPTFYLYPGWDNIYLMSKEDQIKFKNRHYDTFPDIFNVEVKNIIKGFLKYSPNSRVTIKSVLNSNIFHNITNDITNNNNITTINYNNNVDDFIVSPLEKMSIMIPNINSFVYNDYINQYHIYILKDWLFDVNEEFKAGSIVHYAIDLLYSVIIKINNYDNHNINDNNINNSSNSNNNNINNSDNNNSNNNDNYKLNTKNLQLYGCACYYLANIYLLENKIYDTEIMSNLTGNGFTPGEILNKSKEILKIVDYKLVRTSIYDFYKYYISFYNNKIDYDEGQKMLYLMSYINNYHLYDPKQKALVIIALQCTFNNINFIHNDHFEEIKQCYYDYIHFLYTFKNNGENKHIYSTILSKFRNNNI